MQYFTDDYFTDEDREDNIIAQEFRGRGKVLFIVSTITGNAMKIAQTQEKILQDEFRADTEIIRTADFLKLTEIPEAEMYVVCFWCRKGTMDENSCLAAGKLSGKPVIACGTMGAYPKEEYGKAVRKNISGLISECSSLPLVFLCQGKIDEKRTEKRRALPADDPHYLDDAGYARHLASRTHPDEADLKEASDFIRTCYKFISSVK